MAGNLDPLLEALRSKGKQDGPETATALATVTAINTTGVRVRFDGESIASTKDYARLSGSTDIVVNSRVMMLRSGSTWVVAGGVGPWAGGLLGYATRTSDQGGITSDVALTGLSVTATNAANRLIKVTAIVRADSTTANTVIRTTFRIDGTAYQFMDSNPQPVNIGPTQMGFLLAIPGAGSHTYSLSMAWVLNGGTVTSRGSSTNPAQLLVEDIGPA